MNTVMSDHAVLRRRRPALTMLLVVVSQNACAVAARSESPPDTAASVLEALREADRLEQRVRVYLKDSSRVEGRLTSSGQERFRVSARRFDASSVDSLFIREQSGVGTRAVLAGAGIGALGTMFLAVAGAYAGLPLVTGTGDAALLGGGALVGGLLGAIVATAAADETWHRRWPTH
jgi:hypothetical protein